MFQTKVVEKIKTQYIMSNNFIPENRAVYEIMWKNVVEPDRPQCMLFAYWILYGYKHTLRICNTYCFSIATMVTRMCLIVTFIAQQCLPSLLAHSSMRATDNLSAPYYTAEPSFCLTHRPEQCSPLRSYLQAQSKNMWALHLTVVSEYP